MKVSVKTNLSTLTPVSQTFQHDTLIFLATCINFIQNYLENAALTAFYKIQFDVPYVPSLSSFSFKSTVAKITEKDSIRVLHSCMILMVQIEHTVNTAFNF